MAIVDFKRIDQVYDYLTETAIDTTASSKMPAGEQDRRLAESCRQVCDLLKDWLESDVWVALRASVGGPIADFARDQKQFDRLPPTLQDVLERATGSLIEAVPEYVGQAREALIAAADRDQELFKKAEDKVGALRNEACELAALLSNRNATSTQKSDARVMAHGLLKKVIMLLPPLIIAMAGVTPSQVGHNLEQWGQVLMVTTIQDIAARAELPIWSPIPQPGRDKPKIATTPHRPPEQGGERGRRSERTQRTPTDPRVVPHPASGPSDGRGTR